MVSPFSALLSARVVESESSMPSLYSLIFFGSCINSDSIWWTQLSRYTDST